MVGVEMSAAIGTPADARDNGTNPHLYVLVTPARNEEAYIEQTIRSVVAQTVPPMKWVIVSDGSTDGTDAIAERYAAEYPWIEVLRMPTRVERHFAGKVHAFNAGYEKVKGLEYDIIGSLDADISFEADYFRFLIAQFASDPGLGVAGTPFREGDVQYDYRFSRREHVSGACQLFRKECFEAIGGYIPIKAGAIDLTAVVTARMKGWKTQTFTEKVCIHHRQMGTAKAHIVIATFKSGYGDYRMGVHPVWQLFRSVYQMTRRPRVFGGVVLMAGYTWAMVTRAKKPVSDEFVRFRRKEQLRWLKEYWRRGFGPLVRASTAEAGRCQRGEPTP
jgi:glycosyltransferase involved in cell wall biosynthesis